MGLKIWKMPADHNFHYISIKVGIVINISYPKSKKTFFPLIWGLLLYRFPETNYQLSSFVSKIMSLSRSSTNIFWKFSITVPWIIPAEQVHSAIM